MTTERKVIEMEGKFFLINTENIEVDKFIRLHLPDLTSREKSIAVDIISKITRVLRRRDNAQRKKYLYKKIMGLQRFELSYIQIYLRNKKVRNGELEELENLLNECIYGTLTNYIGKTLK